MAHFPHRGMDAEIPRVWGCGRKTSQPPIKDRVMAKSKGQAPGPGILHFPKSNCQLKTASTIPPAIEPIPTIRSMLGTLLSPFGLYCFNAPPI